MKHQQSSEALGAGKLELDWPCYLVETRPQRQCARRQHYQSIQYTLACYFLLFMLAWPRGAVNCQDSSLKHKQQRHHARLAESATSGTLAAAKQDCAPDCLASPLVAIVDRQRLDAYLLSGSQRKHTRAHLGGAAGSRHLEYPVGVGKLHYGTSSLATPLHNKRPAYLGPLDLHTPDHMSSRSVQSAKRLKSDENCPMTGPMTLCDQIDSYPAELILSKLAAVKEALRWSSFNLDSLFTDEREHSSEPFNETLSSPASDRSSQHRANASASPGRPNIDRALGQWQRHGQTGDSGRRTYRSAMAEFVDLVERRAIKLDGSGSQTQAGYLRRARRQAGSSMPSSAFSSSSQVSSAVQVLASAGSQAELEDPERAATFADSNPLPSFTEPICRVRSIYISPRAALNDKKQWKYVVNAPERVPQIKQIIRVDICEDPFGPCSSQVSVPLGFISQCKQKYSKKKLLAFDSQTNQLEVDTFFVPSCCVCQLAREQADEPAAGSATSPPEAQLEPETGGSG